MAGLSKTTEIVKKQGLVYGGDKQMTRQGVEVIPWNQIDDAFIHSVGAIK
jgi:hypothetical protein